MTLNRFLGSLREIETRMAKGSAGLFDRVLTRGMDRARSTFGRQWTAFSHAPLAGLLYFLFDVFLAKALCLRIPNDRLEPCDDVELASAFSAASESRADSNETANGC